MKPWVILGLIRNEHPFDLYQIVVIPPGLNLLGALELAVFLCVALFFCSPYHLPRNHVIVSLTGKLIFAVDFVWRWSQEEVGKVWRWFSPVEGGWIICLPGWTFGAILVGVFAMAWLKGIH